MTTMHGFDRARRMAGFGLVEILIAMVISLFLMAGMVQIFLGSKKAYRTQEAVAQVQEGGRFAMEMLGRDLRMAGYQGCGSLAQIMPNVIANNMPGRNTFDGSDAVRGYSYDGSTFSPSYGDTGSTADDPANVVANTDVITISRVDDCGAYLVGNMVAENANIQINGDNSCDFAANDLLLISDCSSSDLFRATNVSSSASKVTIAHASNANTTNKLSKTYGQDARVYKFVRRDYYIRNNAYGEPALYRRDNGGTPQEVIEGVSDLQLLYGEDTNGDQYVDNYVGDPTSISDWSNVSSVRLSVEMTSTGQIDTVKTSESDKEGRASFQRTMTSTFSIRNKLP